MLTYEKVPEVFKDYLSQDPDYEIVRTSHGYTNTTLPSAYNS